MPQRSAPAAQLRFGLKNWVLMGAAVGSLALGYFLLSRGDTVAAPILLVTGYCVLFPLGVAL